MLPDVPDEIRKLLSGTDGRLPLWANGIQLTTPPNRPEYLLLEDGAYIEYLFGFPLLLVDPAPWPELTITSLGTEIRMFKPTTAWSVVGTPGSKGNSKLDLGFTVMSVQSNSNAVDEHKIFETVRRCLEWIRIVGRQHWVLNGLAAPYAACRGTSFTRRGMEAAQHNFVGYGKAVALRPLTQDQWVRIGTLLSEAPPVSESIFCDAINSYLSHDCVKCMLEVGVAAEVEVTTLMDEIEALAPVSTPAVGYSKRKSEARDSFYWKLLTLSAEFGLPDPTKFTPPGVPVRWVENLLTAYRSRGRAAHRGRCVAVDSTFSVRDLAPGELIAFLLSAEALFFWSQECRKVKSLKIQNFEWSKFDDKPLMAFVASDAPPGGVMKGRATTAGTLSTSVQPKP